ncbi:hypothetical protein GCM10010211_61510 [Streptomyces albospinus]|uniref:Uncharacterized protein n=1 Tax=Streptomyces albospinus TaxID=285515 RepID=A0ABQ2VHB7_9ACTN|nr:hypothetical protein [Streptomyces albospinus]GGU87060.1 hypothetical protein GCM10010211_61510 [Streptomyces albospinus]
MPRDAGARVHAELSHLTSPGADRAAGKKPRRLATSGQLDRDTRQAPARTLAQTTGDQPAFFAYDLAPCRGARKRR